MEEVVHRRFVNGLVLASNAGRLRVLGRLHESTSCRGTTEAVFATSAEWQVGSCLRPWTIALEVFDERLAGGERGKMTPRAKTGMGGTMTWRSLWSVAVTVVVAQIGPRTKTMVAVYVSGRVGRRYSWEAGHCAFKLSLKA